MRSKLIVCTTAAFLAGVGAASAADEAGQKFITEAIQGNLAEVQMGKLAQDRGQSDAVRSFGQTLVADYSAANEKARATAQQLGVTPPTQPTATQTVSYDKLAKMSGEAFDREFAKMMVMDHRKDVTEFQKESKGSDPAAQYAKDALPTLEKHLKMAEELEKGKTAEKHSER
jgi:putative membrane protein